MIAEHLARRRLDDALVLDDDGTSTVEDALRLMDSMRVVLASAGLGATARVGVVMPNGRFLALTALAAMSVAAFAPLNPRLSEDAFVEVFVDMGLDALVTTAGSVSAACYAARRCNMSIIEVNTQTSCCLVEPAGSRPASHEEAFALLLQTSGTTARPKLVGLTWQNLISSASAVAETLQLTPVDRCLSVMPLFHIHGLVGVLLSSVISGASIDVRAGFDPAVVRRRLGAPDITWMSAVPSMYRALLARASHTPVGPNLRFIRSSSAALPSPVWQGMEGLLQCPLINAYGMTEAAHQMTSNPLPPGNRLIGTVGPSAGADIAVLIDGQVTTAVDTVGEVVIRGGGVIAGYLSPAAANESACHEGWFRTGDTGALDGAGYLTLRGRIKEIINVAGEKVSPFEVESVLAEHPQVVDSVAFAVPDRLRGERVCAAVVMCDGAGSLDEQALRRFLSDRLVGFKVPRRVVAVDHIPLGPTGKVQRANLSRVLGLGDPEP